MERQLVESPPSSPLATQASPMMIEGLPGVAGSDGVHRLSRMVLGMQPSQTAAVTDKATELRREGRDIISLSVGEPDFPPPPCIKDALAGVIENNETRYTEVAGTMKLRETICGFLGKKGAVYEPDQICVSNGGKQCIAQALMATCQPGDEVIVPSPYWVSYPEMVKMAGATPVFLETTEEDEYLLTAETLSKALTERTRLVILCNPSNPTGSLYTRAGLEALAQVVALHPSMLVLSDEIYEKITFDGEHYPFAAISGMQDRTITVNGVSKAFAMTGFRLGFVAAPKSIAKACVKIQGQLTSCASSVSQACALVGLRDVDDAFFRAANATFRQKRDFVLGSLRGMPGIVCPTPQGAFYVFPTVSHYFGWKTPTGSTIRTSSDLCVYLLEQGVALVPGEAFGAPGRLRISYATSMESLEQAMERIRTGLEALELVA